MNKKKTFISLILAGVMSFAAISQCLVFAEAEVDTEVITEAQVLDSKPYMKRAIDVLSALDVVVRYTDGSYKIDEAATRADLVVNILRMMYEEEINVNANVVFPDVTEDYWAYKEIYTAYNLGIINGYKDGLFRPDSSITLNEAVKVIINLLGYQTLAEAKGGYPVGYTNVANDYGLLKNIGVANGDLPINRGNMAVLLYNAIGIGMAEPSVFGSTMSIEYNSNETIISKHRNIYKGEGIVTANTVTGIGDSTRLSDSIEVTYDEVASEYKVGEVDADKYLGYYTHFYYKYDDSTDTGALLYIYEDEKKNNVLELSADAIAPNSNSGAIKYYKDPENESGLKTALVNERANVIYNGVYVGYKAHALDEKLLKPLSGSIKLFDNDNDDRYDIVSITSYKHFYVDSVVLTENVIYDRYQDSPIRLEDYEAYKITMDGAPVELSTIESGDIIAIADNERYAEIIVVTNEPLVGSVTASDGDEFIIAGEEIKVSKSYNMSNTYFSFDPRYITGGSEGTFYFDIDGKIVAFEAGSGAEKFAFVMKAKKVEEEEYVNLKLLDSDGSFKTYKVAKKVKVDGVRREEATDILTDLKNSGMDGTGADGLGYYQVLAYKVNSKNEINYIDTTTLGSDEVLDETLSLDIDDRKSTMAAGREYNASYFPASKMFVPNSYAHLPNKREGGASTAFSVAENTPVFVIPLSIDPVTKKAVMNLDNEPEENFSAMSVSGLQNDPYIVSAYSLDRNNSNCAKAVTIKKVAGGMVDRSSSIAVVTKKIDTVNSDGDKVTLLTLLQAGAYIQLSCEEDAVVKTFNYKVETDETYKNMNLTLDYIKKGHTISYSQNLQGIITNIDVLYPRSNDDPTKPGFGDLNPNEPGWVWGLADTDNKIYGKVLARSGNVVKVKTENVWSQWSREYNIAPIYTFFDLTNTKISLVDLRNGEIIPGKISDIVGAEQGDDNCFIICTYHNYAVDTAVVYKFDTISKGE